MTDAPPETVGWLFIQQYYTKLNADPEKLYQFYTRASMMIHGFEGESVPVAHGQAEVQDRVRQERFKDCKVVVSTVDCLPSQNDGVLVQVLGELANQGKRPHKFVQTFFLASQDRGYFVLNDILRLLKDLDNEDDLSDDDDDKAAAPLPEHAAAFNSHQEAVNGEAHSAHEQLVREHYSQAPSINGTHLPIPTPSAVGSSSALSNGETLQNGAETPGHQSPRATNPPTAKSVETKEQIPHPAPSTPAPAETKVPAVQKEQTEETAWDTKPSWASIVSQAPPAKSPQRASQPKPIPSTASKSGSARAAPKTEPRQETRSDKKPDHGPRIFYSAYLKNVSADTDQSALKAALETIGTITHLQIEPERGRAFVDFIDKPTLDKALALKAVDAGPVKVLIEERKRVRRTQKKD